MTKSAKKKNKSGIRSGVSENQCNVAMAALPAGESAYNFQAPETSTILNQANNVLYPPSGQLYVSSYNNGQQFQHMMQNPIPNRQYMNNMNNVSSVNNNNSISNNNNTMHMNGQSYAQLDTVQSPGVPTSFGNNGTAIGTMQGPGPWPSIVDLVQQMNSQLNTRLSGIEQNLSKLTAIENNIAGVQTEISNIKSDNVVLRTNVGELDRFCQSVSGFMDDYNRKHTSTNTYIKKIEQENKTLRSDYISMKADNQNLASTVSYMKENMLEMESRSMKNNILFFGIGEHAVNLRDRSFREDTEQVLKRFMEREIAFEGADSLDPYAIKFERVHRLGRPRYDQNGCLIRPRPIVAAFANFKERKCVRRSSGSIKDKAYSVREQFPADIEERRKILYPFLKSAKSPLHRR